jgi:hypothetical protein
MNSKLGNHQLLICRNEYIRLARQVEQKGISQNEIEICKTTLVELRDSQWLLKPIAFLPTGVALGCPLPQIQVQKLFHRITRLIERWLQGEDDPNLPVFAYVPPQSYHITIVNRSHYEYNEIVPLTLDEQKSIQQAVSRLQIGMISVVAGGLFLTHTGRLFVKCFVFDDKILNLRTVLAEFYPQLRTNVPKLVHIKIGHLMKPLNQAQLLEFGTWLERFGYYTISRIDFTDLYTPAGRIEL